MKASAAITALLIASAVLVSCGESDKSTTEATSSAAIAPGAPRAGTDTSETVKSGQDVDGSTIAEPPTVDGDVISAEDADAVARTFLTAWLEDDIDKAKLFAVSPSVAEELFNAPAPGTSLSSSPGYCAADQTTGSYFDCSYSIGDSSPDGMSAFAATVQVVDGRVLVATAGLADWND